MNVRVLLLIIREENNLIFVSSLLQKIQNYKLCLLFKKCFQKIITFADSDIEESTTLK